MAPSSPTVGSQTPVGVVPLGPVQVRGMTPQPQAQGWRFQARRVDGWGRPLEMGVTAWHFAHGVTVFQAAVWRAGASMGGAKGEDVANAYFQSFQFRP